MILKLLFARLVKIAEYINDRGYRVIHLDGRNYRSHRVVWCWMLEQWPSQDIDHVNRVRSDNCLSNLRDCSRSENHGGNSAAHRDGTGHKGLTRIGKRWQVRIMVRGVWINLGVFGAKCLAAAAYRAAAREAFGEFARA